MSVPCAYSPATCGLAPFGALFYFMTLNEIVQQMPPAGDIAIKVSGLLGGGSFFAGMALDPTWFSSIGTFMGGLAALITIIYTIVRNRSKSKK